MSKGKTEKNDIPLPPEGGHWRFVMTSGMVIPGEMLGRYDNAIVIRTPADETVVIQIRHIESCWEGKGKAEEQKEGEDKA